ncbi:hypothetical protein Golax_012284 [Gossypium laxum]|uniref:Uncharacterized protein n=1 Tax=Gossypium laxum TaxID=34288 RepID=A0A7J8ZN76_9ROSI|nr:hypothetical protein [Gossypium laxum]
MLLVLCRPWRRLFWRKKSYYKFKEATVIPGFISYW